jgi:transcriptional regulator with XRE-family HTH domain/anti-sigma regulatory factor (Ser/Thr protein kinase)
MTAEVIPLGARLKQRREELGISQTQAARELDVARTAYRLWEMEAARPAPDRWRVIAKWLGISMTALLLAGELLDEEEALNADRVAQVAGLTSASWEAKSDASVGDYFSQERSMIAEQSSSGRISLADAASLRRVLDRIQGVSLTDAPRGWHPGRFVKQFPSTPDAPAFARAALTATAVGIPADVFDSATLLLSELVTNSVRHSGSEVIEVRIALDLDRLRIEVADAGTQPIRPRTPDASGGWGLALVGELATSWGVDRQPAGKRIWIEFDLSRASV